ncbi:MAG TPA: DMT family transporter [Micromonosporaceae bacterium]
MPPRSRLDVPTTAAIVVAVAAVSSSAPLIAFAVAPALAIAFWRNALAAGLLAPTALATRRTELAGLVRSPTGRRTGLVCVLAGVFLAAHFSTWIPSAKLTTVAAATALGATQPVWQGLIALVQGRRLSRLTWLGIAIAVLGAAVASRADFAASPKAFIGDLLAVVGGMAAAGYTAFGERARTAISTTTYTTVCYGVCALLIGVGCLSWGVPLHGFPATTWLAIAALTVGPQLLGHSMFNYALHRISATTVSVLILLEVPGAALIGWLWLGQTPRAAAWPGLVLLVVGVAVVVLGSRRPARPSDSGAPPVPDAVLTG